MTALKILTIILFVILTIFTVKIHPEMHQPVLIEPADFKLVRESDSLINKQIPVTTTPAKTKDTEVKVAVPSGTETKYVQTAAPPANQQERTVYNPPSPKPQIQENTEQLELLQRLLEQAQEEQPQPAETPKPAQPQKPVQQQPKPVQPKSTFKNPYMTEQEEIIAWNKWRSDIQNRIMVDSNIDYAPLGTIFLFSCVIDKYGNVSNIKTWSSNSDYTSIARNKVKPAISRLQGQPILRFPRGTQRTTTVFNGAFMIGLEDRYSTPNDYSDFERIMR